MKFCLLQKKQNSFNVCSIYTDVDKNMLAGALVFYGIAIEYTKYNYKIEEK